MFYGHMNGIFNEINVQYISPNWIRLWRPVKPSVCSELSLMQETLNAQLCGRRDAAYLTKRRGQMSVCDRLVRMKSIFYLLWNAAMVFFLNSWKLNKVRDIFHCVFIEKFAVQLRCRNGFKHQVIGNNCSDQLK